MPTKNDPLSRLRLRKRLPAPADRRTIRLGAGLSIYDVAGIVGVTPQAVSSWEHGVTPSSHTIGPYVALLESLATASQHPDVADTGPAESNPLAASARASPRKGPRRTSASSAIASEAPT